MSQIPTSTLYTIQGGQTLQYQIYVGLVNATLELLVLPVRDGLVYSDDVSLVVYLKAGSAANASSYDYKATLPQEVAVPAGVSAFVPYPVLLAFKFSPPAALTAARGNYYVAVQSQSQTAGSLTLAISSMLSSCKYLADDVDGSGAKGAAWRTSAMHVGRLGTPAYVHCETDHLSTFAADMYVAPNELNVQEALANLADLGSNAAVFATVLVVLLLYAVLAVLLWRLDRSDLKHVRATATIHSRTRTRIGIVLYSNWLSLEENPY